MNRMPLMMSMSMLATATLIGCQSADSKPAATKPAAQKVAGSSGADTTNASKVSSSETKVAVNDNSFAELERAAAAAARGEPIATAANPAIKTGDAAAPKVPSLPASPHDKAGFTTKVDDGRLWVFKVGAKELAEFIKHGELVKSVTKIGVGPNRMTVRSSDAATIDAYLAAAPKTVNVVAPSSEFDKVGFNTAIDDGRLWVFKNGAKEIAEFVQHGELVKSVTRIAVGPNRMSVRAADAATIDAYLTADPVTKNEAPVTAAPAADPYARPGFVTKMHDGRLWVFKADAKELPEFEKGGELAKSVTRVAAGPNRITLRSPDAATIDAYIEAWK